MDHGQSAMPSWGAAAHWHDGACTRDAAHDLPFSALRRPLRLGPELPRARLPALGRLQCRIWGTWSRRHRARGARRSSREQCPPCCTCACSRKEEQVPRRRAWVPRRLAVTRAASLDTNIFGGP